MTGRGWRLPWRPFGFPIELDPSFALILPLYAYLIGAQIPALARILSGLGIPLEAAAFAQGAWPWLWGGVAALGLFASVLVHELGHAAVARAYGVKTKVITLWFLGGVAQLDDIPRGRGAEAVVALVGPVISGALAWLLWTLAHVSSGTGGGTFVLAYLAITNLGLALFNLLPALPLDGGRVLRSLLAMIWGEARATRTAGIISRSVAIALGVYGVLSLQIFLVVVAFFIDAAARSEVLAGRIRRTFEGRTVAEMMLRDPITLDLGWTHAQARRLLEFRPLSRYPVVDALGAPLGWLAATSIVDGDAHLERSLLEPYESVRAAADLESSFRQLGTSHIGRLMVVDDEGRLVGLLTKSDVMRALATADTWHNGGAREG